MALAVFSVIDGMGKSRHSRDKCVHLRFFFLLLVRIFFKHVKSRLKQNKVMCNHTQDEHDLRRCQTSYYQISKRWGVASSKGQCLKRKKNQRQTVISNK